MHHYEFVQEIAWCARMIWKQQQQQQQQNNIANITNNTRQTHTHTCNWEQKTVLSIVKSSARSIEVVWSRHRSVEKNRNNAWDKISRTVTWATASGKMWPKKASPMNPISITIFIITNKNTELFSPQLLRLLCLQTQRRRHLLTFGSEWSHEKRTAYARTMDPQRRESPQAQHTSPRGNRSLWVMQLFFCFNSFSLDAKLLNPQPRTAPGSAPIVVVLKWRCEAPIKMSENHLVSGVMYTDKWSYSPISIVILV